MQDLDLVRTALQSFICIPRKIWSSLKGSSNNQEKTYKAQNINGSNIPSNQCFFLFLR